jgi:hypothetical protein
MRIAGLARHFVSGRQVADPGARLVKLAPSNIKVELVGRVLQKLAQRWLARRQ